jgi:hypothetical protein
LDLLQQRARIRDRLSAAFYSKARESEEIHERGADVFAPQAGMKVQRISPQNAAAALDFMPTKESLPGNQHP